MSETSEITRLSLCRDVLPAAITANPMAVAERLARRGGGIGLIPTPGNFRVVAISDPQLLRRILLLDEMPESFTDRRGVLYSHLRQLGPHGEPGDVLDGGPFTEPDHETWKRIRRASVINNVPQLTENLVAHFAQLLLKERAKKKERIDLLCLLKAAFIHALSLRLFGMNMQKEGRALLMLYAPEYFERMAWQLLFALLPGKKGFGRKKYAQTGRALGLVLEEMIDAGLEDRPKFEGSLLHGLLGEFNAANPRERQIIKGTLGTEVMAAFDSVGVVVAQACYALAKDQGEQEKLRIEGFLASHGEPFTTSMLRALPLTNKRWELTLHRNPAFRIIFRNVTRDCIVEIEREGVIGKYILKQGDQLLLLIGAAHHHPAYWSEEHMTLAHTTEGWTERERNAHFPFGDGERECPGKTYANKSGPLLLATLFQHCKITLPLVRIPGTAMAMTSPLRSTIFEVEWL